MKLAQLPYLIRLNRPLNQVKSHLTLEKYFPILIDKSFKATGVETKNLGKARTILTFLHIPKQGETNLNHEV